MKKFVHTKQGGRSMSLADRCGYEFDTATKNRGTDSFRRGHVSLKQVSGTSALAHVRGSYGVSYAVEFDWSDARQGFLSGRCTCPHFADGFLCKHLWATLLALDQKGHGAAVPGTIPLEVVDFDDEEEWGGDEDDWDGPWDDDMDEDDDLWSAFPSLDQLSARSAGGAANGVARRESPTALSANPVSAWQQILRPLGQNEFALVDQRQVIQAALNPTERFACYVLNVAWSQNEGELVIELAEQERLPDGAFGERKRLTLREQSLGLFRDPVDRRFLAWTFEQERDSLGLREFALGSSSLAPNSVMITPDQWNRWLPELCGTGRFLWCLEGVDDVETARPVRWDEGPAWSFRPRVVAAPGEGGWRLEGVLVRGDQQRPLSEVVLVLEKGLVLFEDSLARFERADHLPLLTRLRAAGPLAVPEDERDEFLQTLSQLPYYGAIELPADLRLPEVEVPPQPLLRVKAPDQHLYRNADLYGEVLFCYDDEQLPFGDPRQRVVAPNEQCLLIRNRQVEEERLVELRGLPVRLPGGYDTGPGDVRISRANLHELVNGLLERGWEVEAEGLLVRRPGDFNIQVTSGVDWFELNASVDYDGTVVQLPALLAARKKGEKYIRLDDGTQGLLPEEWLARFDKLAGLGDEDSGGIRFGRSQALLLDALLAEQENVRTDLSFRKLRDRLRSFGGIKPGKPPRGFQGELRDYQKAGLGWFKFLDEMGFGGCLADDMGLGKTVQVLALLQHRRTRPPAKDKQRLPSLCVVPKSLVFNWIDEAQRFTPRLGVVNYTGLERKQRQHELEDADLIVTTYGTLRRDVAEFKDRRFDYVILDEAQAIKNHNSQAAKACRLLAADHRLALTGTPIENHLGELWSLFEFINPGMLGNCTAFASLCRGVRNNGHGEALTDLSRAIAPFVLRRTKEQVLKELPAKTEQTIYCELSRKERKEYDELREYYRARITKQIDDVGLEKSTFHVLEALLRLRQAACHPGLLDKKKVGQPSAKLEALLEQVREATGDGHKALVFSQFTSLLSIVRDRLDREGIVYEYLDGRTRKRKERVERFQTDPGCRLFLISLKAGGHGLNLTAADYVFILDPWWNPAVEAQAIDRTHRIGQSRRVFAYRLIAKDTVEEKVVELQKQKRELADAIVTANESLIRKLTAEDLQQILS